MSVTHETASVNRVVLDSDVRRRPAQARSRERFERILAAAATLIGARGVGSLTMTDIADEAGMALTAVYRYFPNQHAVLRELALQTFAHDTATIVSAEVDPGATVEEILTAGIEEFWHRHLAEPFRIPLRAAIRADAELAALDLAESRRNAAALAPVLARAAGRTDVAAVECQALLLVELVDSLMSLALRVPRDEAQGLIREFVVMASRRLASPGDDQVEAPSAGAGRAVPGRVEGTT